MKEREKLEKKARRGSIGSFFFGQFIGFILCLLMLGGIGAFVYFNVSASWINNTFKTNIDLGSEETNKLTLNNAVNRVINLANNIDTYTLNNLQNDFGIKVDDKVFGFDISDLKNTAVTKLPDALMRKVENLSAKELGDIIDLSEMDSILSTEIKLYLNGNTLYATHNESTNSYSNQVSFDYKVNGNSSVIIKGETFNITDGKIRVQIKNIPLVSGIPVFVNSLGDILTIEKLEDFGIELPSFFDNIDKTASINELETIIKDMVIADFMDYKIVDGKVYDKDNEEVKGILARLIKKKIGELENVADEFDAITIGDLKDFDIVLPEYIQNLGDDTLIKDLGTKIDNLYVADIMEYTIEDDKVYDKSNVEVTGVIAKIAKKQIKDLNNIDQEFEDMTLGDIKQLDIELPDYLNKLDDNTLVSELGDAIDTLYVADFMGYHIVGGVVYNSLNEEVTGIEGKIGKLSIADIKTDGKIQEIVDDMLISEVIDTTSATGVLKAISDTKIGELTTKVNTLQIYEVLGLTYSSAGDFYFKDANSNNVYDLGEEKAGTLINTLATTTINGLEAKINTLTIADVLGLSYDDTAKVYYKDDNNNGTYNSGEEVSAIINTLASTDIDGLEAKINTLTIADVLGLKYDDTAKVYYKDDNNNGAYNSGEEVSAIINTLASTDINNLETKINTLKVSDVLGLKYDNTLNIYYSDDNGNGNYDLGEEVSPIINSIAGSSINNLEATIDDLTVGNIFSATDLSNGPLSLIPSSTKIDNIPTALQTAISTKTLGELQTAGVVDSNLDLTKTIPVVSPKYPGEQIGSLTINQIIEYIVSMP